MSTATMNTSATASTKMRMRGNLLRRILIELHLKKVHRKNLVD